MHQPLFIVQFCSELLMVAGRWVVVTTSLVCSRSQYLSPVVASKQPWEEG